MKECFDNWAQFYSTQCLGLEPAGKTIAKYQFQYIRVLCNYENLHGRFNTLVNHKLGVLESLLPCQ